MLLLAAAGAVHLDRLKVHTIEPRRVAETTTTAASRTAAANFMVDASLLVEISRITCQSDFDATREPRELRCKKKQLVLGGVEHQFSKNTLMNCRTIVFCFVYLQRRARNAAQLRNLSRLFLGGALWYFASLSPAKQVYVELVTNF